MASILMGGHGAGRATPAPPSTLLATQSGQSLTLPPYKAMRRVRLWP